MAKLSLTLTHASAGDFRGLASMRPRDVVANVFALLKGAVSGVYVANRIEVATVQASGTVTLATASGAIAAVINGVSVGVTFATSDANTASLLAAAINASVDPLVAPIVEATASGAVVTIRGKAAGPCGNAITLGATGVGATASGARLTGGANTGYNF